MTSPSSLCVAICFGEQYHKATPYGMWYLSLKASILAGDSTKCLNLQIWTNLRETTEIGKWRSKNCKAKEIGQGEKENFKEIETYKS